MRHDIFHDITRAASNAITSSDRDITAFFVHAVICILLPLALSLPALLLIGRNAVAHLCIFVVGVFLGGTIPMPEFKNMPAMLQLWVIAACSCMLIVIPVLFSRITAGEKRQRAAVIIVIYLLFVALLFLNCRN